MAEDRFRNPVSGGVVEVNDGERAITFRLSTPEIDNQNEFALPEDWVLTERFKANPVVLWNHRQDIYPVGTCTRPDGSLAFWTNPEGVFAKAYFTDAHEDARAVYAMYRDRTLRGVSPGFHTRQVIPMDYQTARQKGAMGPPRGTGRVNQLRQNDLFEISAVPVPSNASALALPVVVKSFHGHRLSRAVSDPLTVEVGNILAAGSFSVSSHPRFKTASMATPTDPNATATGTTAEPVALTAAPTGTPDLSGLLQAAALHATAIDQLNAIVTAQAATIQAQGTTIAELKEQVTAAATLAARHENEDFPRIANLLTQAAA